MKIFVHILHDPASGRGAAARRRANVKHPSPLLDDEVSTRLPPGLLLMLRTAAMLRGLAAALDVTASFADEVVSACARGLPAAQDLEDWKNETGFGKTNKRRSPSAAASSSYSKKTLAAYGKRSHHQPYAY